MKILTPVLRVLSFTKLRFKSQKFPAAAIRKAHPAVRIPPFSVLIQSALPPIISTTIRKTKTELFRLRLTVYPVSAFQTGNASIFKHQHRAQFLYQPIKFCLLFFLSEFGIVSGKAQPGSPGMVMESRKAAPALRARPLRSYVPLRRDPSESVLSGTIPGLHGGHFSPHKFKFLSKVVDKFRAAKYTIRVICREQCPYRGLVKWYDRGLQNLWWEFDSLIPCF